MGRIRTTLVKEATLLEWRKAFVQRWAAIGVALGVAACQGVIGGGAASDGNGAGTGSGKGSGGTVASDPSMLAPGEHPEDCSIDVGTSVLRRLSKLEYRLTIQDLFQLPEAPAADQVPEDGEQGGFKTIAALQTVSDGHLRAYLDLAATLASDLMADAARRQTVLGCDPAAAGCLESFITSFGKVAYRRPLEQEEVTTLAAKAVAVGQDQNDQFQYVIESLLSSPSFLFRVEIGDNAPLATLTPLELASRLAFTLWGRGPSADLLGRAEAGELDTNEGLATVAEQMLQDPRASVFFKDFFRQWLNFETLRVPNTPPPGWSDALMPDMITETDLLLAEYAWTPGQNFLGILNANHTYVTPSLATFYGLTAAGAGPVRVDFPAGNNRENTGILTHAAVISSKTDADLISRRGKWVRGALLCQELEPPANLLATIQTEVAGLSYLEVIQKRNTETACAGCHAQIDPIGVGFAQYDAAGYYDGSISPSDYGLTPRFDGAENPDFANLAELAADIEASPEFASCVAQKVFVYTQGRLPETSDECTLTGTGERFAADGFKFGSIIASMAEAPSFRQRRAPP